MTHLTNTMHSVTCPIAQILALLLIAICFSNVSQANEPETAVLTIAAIELNGDVVSRGSLTYRVNERFWLPDALLEDLELDDTQFARQTTDTNLLYGIDQNFTEITSSSFIDVEFDSKTQSIRLTAAPKAYRQRQLSLNDRHTLSPERSPLVLFTNYSVNTAHTSGASQTNAFLETGVTLPKSVFTHSLISRNSDESELLRLETAWIKDLPSSRSRITVGDAIATVAQGSDLGSTYRFGGLQWGTRLELQPGLIRSPLPTISGEALGKSTVDLFVGESLRARTDADTGPFSVERVPVNTGAGNIRVVVTDLLGRETVFNQPFYLSAKLLRTGLSDYEVNIGALRDSYGRISNDYGSKFISGRYRRGLSPWLTAQALTEISESHGLLGVSTAFAIPELASGSFSAAISDSQSLDVGRRFTASIDRQDSRIGLGLRWSHSDREFRTLQILDNVDMVEEELSANLRLSLPQKSNVSILHTNRHMHDGTDLTITSLTYSQRLFKNIGLTVSGSKLGGSEWNETGLSRFDDTRVDLSLIYAFGGRQSANLRAQRKQSRSRDAVRDIDFSVRKSIPTGGGLGYRLSANRNSASDTLRARGTVDWSTNAGVFSAILAKDGDAESVSASVDGSVVFAEGSLFTQRALRDGFAIVDTGGEQGITVYRGSRPAAVSNAKGLAVIPELVPYSTNTIKIDADELPIMTRIENEQYQTTTYYKGGVLVDFGIKNDFGKLVSLTLEDGNTVPVGATVVSPQTDFIDRVAFDGQVYLRGLDLADRFIVHYQGETCFFKQAQVVEADSAVMCRPTKNPQRW